MNTQIFLIEKNKAATETITLEKTCSSHSKWEAFSPLTSPSQKSNSLTLVLNCCCWLDSFRCWLFSLDFCTKYSHCCWSLVIRSFTISSLPAHLRCSIRPVKDRVQRKKYHFILTCSLKQLDWLTWHYNNHAWGAKPQSATCQTLFSSLSTGCYTSYISIFRYFFTTKGLLFVIYITVLYAFSWFQIVIIFR